MKTILTICLLSLLTSVVSAQSYDFQGLHVGMTVPELNQLIVDTKWGRLNGLDRNEPFDEDNPFLDFLIADDLNPDELPPPDNPFHRWISVNGEWLHWQWVSPLFENGIVTDVSVFSRTIFEEDRNSISPFALALLPTLTGQLGKPVKAVKPNQMQRAINKLEPSGKNPVDLATWRWKYHGGNKHQLAQVKLQVQRGNDRYSLCLLMSDHTSSSRY